MVWLPWTAEGGLRHRWVSCGLFVVTAEYSWSVFWDRSEWRECFGKDNGGQAYHWSTGRPVGQSAQSRFILQGEHYIFQNSLLFRSSLNFYFFFYRFRYLVQSSIWLHPGMSTTLITQMPLTLTWSSPRCRGWRMGKVWRCLSTTSLPMLGRSWRRQSMVPTSSSLKESWPSATRMSER